MVETSNFAIASLILGIISIPFIELFGLGVILGILAIILGRHSLKQIKRKKLAGKGMAIAGIITGGIPLIWLLSIGLLAYFGVLSPASFQEENTIVPETSSLYTNEVYGFSIEPPKNWNIQENINVEGMTAIVAFTGPIFDNFQTNINIKTEDVAGYNLDQYAKASKLAISQFFAANDYILIDEGNLLINNQNAYFLEYVANQGKLLKFKQVFFINKDNAYILTYTALQDKFDSSITDFDHSVSTFKFIN
ncbi:MAG: DUF4190 domain-containing protein [Candidatus Woesearchaeota archaeon]